MCAPLRQFVCGFTSLVDNHGSQEAAMVAEGSNLLRGLVEHDDWLPEASAAADPARYQQHLLWCDPHQRFSVVSFVWGPGQCTPVHDHTVWGLIGMLRGEEAEQRYDLDPHSGQIVATGRHTLRPREVAAVSPAIGDVHEVRNALIDRPSISIHVYGANIGAVHRHVFDLAHHARKDFVSGYSGVPMPNIWH